MRFLQVTTSMDSRIGGPPAILKALTPVLSDLGHSSEFVTTEAPAGPATAEIMGCPIHRLGPPRNSYQYCPPLAPWIQANAARFDAIFVHGLWQHHGISVQRALRKHNTPYFVYTHGMLDPWFKHTYPLKHAKKWIYWNLFEKRVLRDASAVLFTCEEERRLARQSFSNYRCLERVVEFGTSGPPYTELIARAAFATAFPSLAQNPFLLFLSRIHPKKGIDLLLQAYGRAQRQQAGSLPCLVIAGPCQDTTYLNELKATAINHCPPNSVHWIGMLENEIKWGAIYCSEAFVLPSHQENFGIAVTEAMAAGRPVLISDKVNIWREIAEDAGCIASPDTEEGTLATLTKWASMPPAARLAMGAAAKASFYKRFEIGSVARSLVSTIAPFLPNAKMPSGI